MLREKELDLVYCNNEARVRQIRDRRQFQIINTSNKDGSLEFVLSIFILSLFLTGGLAVVDSSHLVQSRIPVTGAKTASPGYSYSLGNWKSEVMYTATVENYIGWTLFSESDSTDYSSYVTITSNGDKYYGFSQLYGMSVTKNVGFGVTYNDVSPAQLSHLIWVVSYPGSTTYISMAEYQHSFTASDPLWEYDVSYSLYLYAYQTGSLQNNIQGGWSFESNSNTIQPTFAFPVEFGD